MWRAIKNKAVSKEKKRRSPQAEISRNEEEQMKDSDGKISISLPKADNSTKLEKNEQTEFSRDVEQQMKDSGGKTSCVRIDSDSPDISSSITLPKAENRTKLEKNEQTEFSRHMEQQMKNSGSKTSCVRIDSDSPDISSSITLPTAENRTKLEKDGETEFSRHMEQQLRDSGSKTAFVSISDVSSSQPLPKTDTKLVDSDSPDIFCSLPLPKPPKNRFQSLSSSHSLPKAENKTKLDSLNRHTASMVKFGLAPSFIQYECDQIQHDHPSPLSEKDKISLREILTESNNVILEHMTERQRSNFIEKSEIVQYGEEDFITTRGNDGEYFFTIKEGNVKCYIEDSKSDDSFYTDHEVANISSGEKSDVSEYSFRYLKRSDSHSCEIFQSFDDGYDDEIKPLKIAISDEKFIAKIGPGYSFGEQALLYKCKNLITHVAESQLVTVWRINKQDFRDCMSKLCHQPDTIEQETSLKALRKVDILNNVDEVLLTDISRCMIPTTFLEGERIINKGETGNLFYIIKSGNVRIHNIGIGDSQYSDVILGEGEWFGESAFTKATNTSAHVTTDSNVVELLVLAKADCHRLRDQLQTALEEFKLEKTLAAIPMFAQSNLSTDDIKKLLCLSQSQEFRADQTIARMGETFAAAIYIVRFGKIRVSNESTNGVHDLIIGDYFGENSICEDINFINNLTIKTLENTRCVIITKEMIERVIGSVSRLGTQMRLVSRKLESSIEVSDLKKECILGIGAFGKVWLVKHKKTGSVYALKVMEKFKILKLKAVKNIIREKNILGSINHIFILDLVTVLQDDQSLYLLTNFIQGGELFSLIHKGTKHGMLNDCARFYGACIFETLSFLHHRNICYRDLKPENLVIDRDGYSILIDFGFAKLVSNKTYTLCGTPEYFSPEIILGQGYGLGVDEWAFGILLYEMILGRTPFARKNNAYLSIANRIIKGRYKFPEKGKDTICVSSSAKALISSLLCSDIEKRAGFMCKKNDEILMRNHPWFEDIFENDLLLKKLIPAPWIPTINDSMDSSNFDNFKKDETKEKKSRIRTFSNEQQKLFEDF